MRGMDSATFRNSGR